MRIELFAGALCAALLVSPPAGAGIRNGDFEAGGFASWDAGGWGNAFVAIEEEEDGNHLLTLGLTEGVKQSGGATALQIFTVTGQAHTLSFDYWVSFASAIPGAKYSVSLSDVPGFTFLTFGEETSASLTEFVIPPTHFTTVLAPGQYRIHFQMFLPSYALPQSIAPVASLHVDNVKLDVLEVPEPSTLALGILGVAAVSLFVGYRCPQSTRAA